MLNEIRDEYKLKDQEMRDELHRKCRSQPNWTARFRTSLLVCLDQHEYNQHVKKNLDRNLIETNREDLERRHLANELNSLHDNRMLLHQKLALIQEHHKQLEINVNRETRRKQDMQENYDEQSKHLLISIREYVSDDLSYIDTVTSISFRRISWMIVHWHVRTIWKMKWISIGNYWKVLIGS